MARKARDRTARGPCDRWPFELRSEENPHVCIRVCIKKFQSGVQEADKRVCCDGGTGHSRTVLGAGSLTIVVICPIIKL